MNKGFVYMMCALLTAMSFIGAGCGHSGGMSDEQLRRETDAALAKQDKISEETERLRRELSQIPAQEQITKTPYRGGNGIIYILEKDSGGEYDFVTPPQGDYKTGEMPAANTLVSALVEYKREPVGTYTIPEENKTVPAYALNADVTVIDHSIPAVIHRKSFKGEKPKSFTGDSNTVFVNKGAQEVLGEKPIEEIRKYLNGLPSKN